MRHAAIGHMAAPERVEWLAGIRARRRVFHGVGCRQSATRACQGEGLFALPAH
jgi:hypothetical protein